MTTPPAELRKRLQCLLQTWRETGAPPRWQLMNTLQEIVAWKDERRANGIYSAPPLMLTATLDDGWGHGLEVIEMCARAAGVYVERLGLLRSAEQIIERCRQLCPQLLGMTVLQLDSEPSLSLITSELKDCTQILVGGPPFQIEPELADRTGVDFVAKNVTDFLDFILHWKVV